MLTENTINLLYKHHDLCNDEEFEEDLTRILFIFRLINRFMTHRETNYKLLINHIITFYNVFGEYAPIALREYAYNYKNKDIKQYLNAVLKACQRLEEDEQEYNREFLTAIERCFSE